jgi:hypothetical protein
MILTGNFLKLVLDLHFTYRMYILETAAYELRSWVQLPLGPFYHL